MDFEEITVIYDEATTITSEGTSSQSATLRLYDVFIPLLGVFIISLNLLVVISSGLLLQKRKFHYVSMSTFPTRTNKSRISCIAILSRRQRRNLSIAAFHYRFSMLSRSTAEKHISLPGKCRIIRFADWRGRAFWSLLPQLHSIGHFVRCSAG